jgi:benzoate 4-monooxygenase
MSVITALWSPWTLAASLALVLAAYAYAHHVTYSHLRHIPAPWPAQFTNLWLFGVARRGQRFAVVDEVHARLGKVVRLAPNHVSIADDAAVQEIYGHGNGFLKS